MIIKLLKYSVIIFIRCCQLAWEILILQSSKLLALKIISHLKNLCMQTLFVFYCNKCVLNFADFSTLFWSNFFFFFMILLHEEKRIVNLSSLHVERPSSVGFCACIWFIIPWPEQIYRYKFASHHSTIHVTRPSILWNIFRVKYSLTLGFHSLLYSDYGAALSGALFLIHILGTRFAPSKVIYIKMDWIETISVSSLHSRYQWEHCGVVVHALDS